MSFVEEPQYATYDKEIQPFSFFGNLVKPKEENPVPELTFLGKHYAPNWQPQAVDNNKLLKTNEIMTSKLLCKIQQAIKSNAISIDKFIIVKIKPS
jgi:hypothetical protein